MKSLVLKWLQHKYKKKCIMHNCQQFIINDLCFSCVFLQIHLQGQLFNTFMIHTVLTEVLTQLKWQILTAFVQRI